MCSDAAPTRRTNRPHSDDLDDDGTPRRKRASRYEIRFSGAFDVDWSSWFEGLTIAVEESPEGSPVSVLSVDLFDQAQLRGILAQILDLNLTLIGVRRLD